MQTESQSPTFAVITLEPGTSSTHRDENVYLSPDLWSSNMLSTNLIPSKTKCTGLLWPWHELMRLLRGTNVKVCIQMRKNKKYNTRTKKYSISVYLTALSRFTSDSTKMFSATMNIKKEKRKERAVLVMCCGTTRVAPAVQIPWYDLVSVYELFTMLIQTAIGKFHSDRFHS